MNTEIIAQDNNPRLPVSTRGDEALERLRARLDALDPLALSRPNVDADVVAGRALAAVPTINALRARMERECPGVDLAAIAEIEDRAAALLAAHARYRTAQVSPQGLVALGTEVLEARGVLAAVCAMLVSCNLLKQAQVPVMTGGRSFRVAAGDTLALVELLKSNWSRIENKVPVTLPQLERLRGASEEVARLVNVRDQIPERAGDAADLRQRALTLLEQGYDEARRAVSFLRWHEGDVDTLLPPLRTHAGAKHDAGEADGNGDTSTPATTGNTAAPGTATSNTVTQAQLEEAMKVFAPATDAKPAATTTPATAPSATPSVSRNKPYADA